MVDLKLTWGADLELAAYGDLALTAGPELTKQRLLRRLLTNESDYIWQADYGAGLARFVGEPTSAARLAGIVRKQAQKEPSVDRSQPVSVNLHENRGSDSISLSIRFQDVADGHAQSVDLLAKV